MSQRRDCVIARAAAAAVLAGGVVGGGFASSASATVADVTATRDNTLYEPDPFFGLVSSGAGDAFFAGKVGFTGNSAIRRGLVRFDLQDVPTNALVNSASVTMFSTKAPSISDLFLHRAQADWGEGTSDAGPTGGQGAAPTTGDVTWQHRFYNTVNWTTPGGDFAATVSATALNVTQLQSFTFASTAQLKADVEGWISNPASNFGWAVLGEETGPSTAQRIASREYFDPALRPKLHVDYSTSTWKIGAGGGAWSASSSWNFGVPNAAGAEANFSFATGNPADVIPVSIDGPKTASILNFTSPNRYVLSGSSLTLDRAAGRNAITVTSGSHRITSDLRLNRSTDINIAPGMALTAGNLSAASGVSIDKSGGGTFTANNIRLDALNVQAGIVAISPSGGVASGTSTLNSLVIATDARLDLGDNKLITNAPLGTFTGGVYTGVQGEVARAYNFGAWDQPGLMTSMPDAGPLVGTTTLGVSNGEAVLFLAPTETGTFGGQPVTGASTIVMYTYAGDLNFDGLVDAADYGVIDNWVQFPGTSGYANGDFNYDGIIDAGDYGIIDNTIQLQGPPIPTNGGALAGVTAVPEPTAAVVLLAPLMSLCRRRRR